MKRTLLIAGPAAAAVVLCASLFPAAFAAPASHAKPATHARPAAAAHVEHFTTTQINPANNANSHVIATGFFTAGGIDHPLNNNNDVFRFPDGTVKIHHPGAKFKFHENKTTCLVRFTIKGKYTLEDGTGAYANITGHGSYAGGFAGVEPRKSNGKCNNKAAPLGFQGSISGHGPVSGTLS
jgi:hypothetical protein